MQHPWTKQVYMKIGHHVHAIQVSNSITLKVIFKVATRLSSCKDVVDVED